MTVPLTGRDFDDYDRLCHEAMRRHCPDLEPYASMPIQHIVALMRDTDKTRDLARYLMLENFVRDKLTAKQFLVHKMAKEVSTWVLREYAEEYPTMAEEGALAHAALAFAMAVLQSVPGQPGAVRRQQ
jgi:hypothetical protein